MKKILKPQLKDFIEFVQEKGVVGLAIGIIIGAAVTKLVTSIVTNLINPIIGVFMGHIGKIDSFTVSLFGAEILIGTFISSLIDFAVVVLLVYFGIKKLGLEKLDKKKN